jgi:hypothetical protein
MSGSGCADALELCRRDMPPALDGKPLYRSLRATLENFDLDYETERVRVGRSTSDPDLASHLLRRLAERHKERCEPYIRSLKILEERSAGEH